MEELILEGNRYKGRIQANLTQTVRTRMDHYSEYTEDCWYWDGVALIEELKTGTKQRFKFTTDISTDKKRGLEQSILNFDIERNGIDKKEIFNKIINKKSIYDLQLQSMYETAKAREEEQIIPEIKPREFDTFKLRKEGMIASYSGQLNIQFGHNDDAVEYFFNKDKNTR